MRLPKRRVVLELVDLLTAPKTPPHTRNAIAWVLQRVLQLPLPPVDPLTGEAVAGRDLRTVRAAAERMPQ